MSKYMCIYENWKRTFSYKWIPVFRLMQTTPQLPSQTPGWKCAEWQKCQRWSWVDIPSVFIAGKIRDSLTGCYLAKLFENFCYILGTKMLGVRGGKPALKNQGKEQLSTRQLGNNRCMRHTGWEEMLQTIWMGKRYFNLVSQTFIKFLLWPRHWALKKKKTHKYDPGKQVGHSWQNNRKWSRNAPRFQGTWRFTRWGRVEKLRKRYDQWCLFLCKSGGNATLQH